MIRFICCLIGAFSLLSCKPASAPAPAPAASAPVVAAPPPASVELVVSTAASLKDVLDLAAKNYHAHHPATTIRLNVGSTGQLTQQILGGAPADLLVSADPKWIDKLIEAKASEASDRRSLAGNELVLVAPKGKSAVHSLADLSTDAVQRIAVGEPKLVPAGTYAKKVLEEATVWDAVSPKLVFGENVRQVLAYVSRGEVDAGFVYRTDARTESTVEVVQTWPLPPNMYEAIVVGAGGHAGEAREFLDFLSGEEVKTMLRDAGFLVD